MFVLKYYTMKVTHVQAMIKALFILCLYFLALSKSDMIVEDSLNKSESNNIFKSTAILLPVGTATMAI